MNQLDRYVGRTVLVAILMVLGIIVGLDAFAAILNEAEDVSESYSFLNALSYVVLTLPGRFYEFIPFAALIGCLIGLGQLATTSELVVMRGAGVSVARLVWITMKPALVVAVAGILLGEYIAPKTQQLAESRRAIALNPGEGVAGKHGLWIREGDTSLHVNALEPIGVGYGITLVRFDEQQRMEWSLSAQRASFQRDHWVLDRAVQTDFTRWATSGSEHTTLRWDTGITPDLLALEVLSPDQLPLDDLYRYGRYLMQQGLEADDFELAFWRKLLQPLAVAGLVLVAISFVFGPLRDGTMGFRIFAGVIVGIVFRTSQDLLGPSSLVFGFSPLYAALAPIAVCILAGLLLLSRAR